MLPAHFHDVEGDLSDQKYGEYFWIVQNSDSDLVTTCFIPILIGITRSLCLYFALALKEIVLQVVRS